MPSFSNIVSEFRERIRREARAKAPSILHYDPKTKDLCRWSWPIHASGERVKPEDLSAHRRTHVFYGPSCLCAFLDDRTIGRDEAMFRSDNDGSHRAACANDRCGYSVKIDGIYMSPGLPVKRYGLREKHLNKDGVDGVDEGLGPNPGIPLAYRRPMNRPLTTFALLMQLDDPSVPGLPDDVFAKLFAQCRACHWVMTTDRFPGHVCFVPPAEERVEVIDLTEEDDSDEGMD